MTHANKFGFLPENDAYANSIALQKALDVGGEITVDLPGVYDLSETVEIGDDTTLIFAKGVKLRRQASRSGKNGLFLVNKGCYTATYNKNIKLVGLHLDCNGIECSDIKTSDYWEGSRFVGLITVIGFIYIKNLVVEDFECINIPPENYAIQISAFENIRLEHLYCQGQKDGVHLGWGKGFVIRHGKFCTFDDPIALNAFDYSTSNTHVGWIEDGLIEDCYDLEADSTTGFFCRILGGAWCDWYPGMQVQHSDTVCHNGRVYRVVMRPNGSFLTSNTPPTHTELGKICAYDGIYWACVRDEAVYDCGCRNIVMRDIHLQKKRSHGIEISLNNDVWARSYYPGCKLVPQSNLSFERIYVENDVEYMLYSNHPDANITISDTDLKNSKIHFGMPTIDGLRFPTVDVTVKNLAPSADRITCEEDHPVNIVNK